MSISSGGALVLKLRIIVNIKKLVPIILLTSMVLSCTDKESTEKVKEKQPETMFNTTIPLALLMEHVVTPAAFGVWGASGFVISESGEHDRAPKNDEEWELVVNHAATLLETSNLMLLPGRIIDERWVSYVTPFSKLGERALIAAETQDAQAISDVGDELVVVCGTCHVAYGLPEDL